MMHKQTLFTSGEDGYHSYRIPALLTTQSGVLLAFCEARKDGGGDAGNIDLALRRSLDGGITWEPMRIIADVGEDTIGNPCPVQDRSTGTIWLLLCRNLGAGNEKEIKAGRAPRDVLYMKSEDDGVTWSELVDITAQVKLPEWTWYATGPCHGIQLQSGRLMVACNHAVLDPENEKSGPYRSHVIYSDDQGQTWQLGGIAGDHTNECTVLEMEDGSLYLNMRSYHGRNRRVYSWSNDGGLSWTAPEFDEALVEPVCQGSVLHTAGDVIYFSNPASERRVRLTVQRSGDLGATWQQAACLHEGPAAYSDLATGPDGSVCCLLECGAERPYEQIVFVSGIR